MCRHRLERGPLRGPEHALELAFGRGERDWTFALLVGEDHVAVHWITAEAALRRRMAEQFGDGPTSLVAVYRARDPADLMAEANRLTEALIGARAIVLRDLLIVSRGRWWSHLCGDKACCPPEGRRLPSGITE